MTLLLKRHSGGDQRVMENGDGKENLLYFSPFSAATCPALDGYVGVWTRVNGKGHLQPNERSGAK